MVIRPWTGDEFGLTCYGSLVIIALMTIVFIIFEKRRRKTYALIDQGYYFVEEPVGRGNNKRLVPVPPDNVDISDPLHPKIINLLLLEQDLCACCYS